MTWEAEFLTSVQVHLSSSSSPLGCLCPLQDEAFSYVPFKRPAFGTLVHSSHPNFVVTSLHLVYRLLLLLFPSPWKKFLTAPYNSAVTPLWHHDYLVQPLKLSSCRLCWPRNVLFNFFLAVAKCTDLMQRFFRVSGLWPAECCNANRDTFVRPNIRQA